ncbi:NAD-dependent epimerase/dehydratase [Streptomyces viridosporus ATCC 14672]|uniref:NAD-dependent epimerase/dehydratase n=1 Tax=Streptomyces viridosporus (strain ATCC 14672 / DSM 40746 / JCM 4963 / KCTC 9882 / NRRL B-12104 / FH 1290) TaxID=566461 RepID=D6A9G7_STRV1|nr:UDP-glucuronic acid decarboxylase family protein [Streptomyces viridosporus]EFE68203.1 NAD-dependent epimerase/dehydratase [Streptomyces viridosporus ATCC 14672]
MTRTAVVAGGAGFVGSHLCERLLTNGWRVVCVDNFVTGSARNVAHLAGESRFRLIEADVCEGPPPITGRVDAVLNLASPASPVDYLELPLETLRVGSEGTRHLLDLARAEGARFVLASTSETYGDPLVHPQPESYWGNVNPVGPRSVYDEAKRYAEALTMAYRRTFGVDTGIVRIFNTYGPRMRAHDGRAVPTFIRQALAHEPITVAGDGSQTRSLCYVSDLVDGLVRMTDARLAGPLNLGDQEEIPVLRLAEWIRDLTASTSGIVHVPRPVDDPSVRRPDITRAREELGWSPEFSTERGLIETIDWFRGQVGADREALQMAGAEEK